MRKFLFAFFALFGLVMLSSCGGEVDTAKAKEERNLDARLEDAVEALLKDAEEVPLILRAVINGYAEAAPNIRLGMTREEVAKILHPSQSQLRADLARQPEVYKKGEVVVEILYARSGWYRDGLSTDDEYTPYIFHNGELVAIGWATLGGVKTRGSNN